MTIFGIGREAITRDWRKLLNVERKNLYCSTNLTVNIKNAVV